jgi:hypothetical protein
MSNYHSPLFVDLGLRCPALNQDPDDPIGMLQGFYGSREAGGVGRGQFPPPLPC